MKNQAASSLKHQPATLPKNRKLKTTDAAAQLLSPQVPVALASPRPSGRRTPRSSTPRAASNTPRAASSTPRAASNTPKAASSTPRAAANTPRAASSTPRAAAKMASPRFAKGIPVLVKKPGHMFNKKGVVLSETSPRNYQVRFEDARVKTFSANELTPRPPSATVPAFVKETPVAPCQPSCSEILLSPPVARGGTQFQTPQARCTPGEPTPVVAAGASSEPPAAIAMEPLEGVALDPVEGDEPRLPAEPDSLLLVPQYAGCKSSPVPLRQSPRQQAANAVASSVEPVLALLVEPSSSRSPKQPSASSELMVSVPTERWLHYTARWLPSLAAFTGCPPSLPSLAALTGCTHWT